MTTLEELTDSNLPLNRKERFYTGTVLPMIVCRDNFKYFAHFISLIKGCEQLQILGNPNSTNIQFFTEYSLVESIYGEKLKGTFADRPKSKDTPDIIILINDKPKFLIAIEAKMYDVPESASLRDQMNKQKVHIKYLSKKLGIDNSIQCALLPEKLGSKMHGLGFQIITWEQIRDEFKKVCPGDYFLALLKISLDSYDKLVAEHGRWGKNCDKKISGQDIYDSFTKNRRVTYYDESNKKEKEVNIMGRFMGLEGDYLLEDIKEGGWRKHKYETSTLRDVPNDNWFPIKNFVEHVDRIGIR